MRPEMMTHEFDELLAPDQLLAAVIGDLAVKDDVSEGVVAMETPIDAAPTELFCPVMHIFT
jgi:H/ACA ribonucleoprotein complex non-core subunit NAF1